LANIQEELLSNGGGAYNVLRNLVALGVNYPLAAAGLVGADENGDWIRSDCERAGIDVSLLGRSDEVPTSYTDVMSVATTGRRTFFHQRGSNARFDLTAWNGGGEKFRLFHLAYLMLLDRMDEWVVPGRSRAAEVLEMARARGLTTSVDLVSAPHPEFAQLAESSLGQVDYFIANEVETGWILDRNLVGAGLAALGEAALLLKEKAPQAVPVIHSEEGVVAVGKEGAVVTQRALELPAGFIKGATGAGDAFAAGFLHGVHECLSLEDSLHLGICVAASSLHDPTPSAGVMSVEQCLALGQTVRGS
jgi:sugar/nucleoside kinase (ribokinase family)